MFVKGKYNPTTSSPMLQIIKWYLLFSVEVNIIALLPASISLLLPHLYPSLPLLAAGPWNAIHASFFCACDSLGMEHLAENPPTSSSLLFLSLFNEVAAPKSVVIAPLFAFLEVFISYDCPLHAHSLCL